MLCIYEKIYIFTFFIWKWLRDTEFWYLGRAVNQHQLLCPTHTTNLWVPNKIYEYEKVSLFESNENRRHHSFLLSLFVLILFTSIVGFILWPLNLLANKILCSCDYFFESNICGAQSYKRKNPRKREKKKLKLQKNSWANTILKWISVENRSFFNLLNEHLFEIGWVKHRALLFSPSYWNT